MTAGKATARSDRVELRQRRRELTRDDRGYREWAVREESVVRSPADLALLLCDVWDTHPCRGAVERLELMLPQMASVVEAARERGILIVHAPSDTMDYYHGHPARRRVQETPAAAPPPDAEHLNPPVPVDIAAGWCDTDDRCDSSDEEQHPWTRQHEAIHIDPKRDVISDNGREIYSQFRMRGIACMLIMGVHTNVCILERSFAIKQMVRWGIHTLLVRDLTDAVYDPAYSPYVSHEEGTRLVIEFIEKFWCPTIDSAGLLAALRGPLAS